jgi:hypothetical protein
MPAWMQARLTLERGDPAAAAVQFEQAAAAQEDGNVALQMSFLAEAGHAWLRAGQPARALAATSRAVALHAAKGYAWLDGAEPPVVWWRHSQALRANGRRAEADVALERAYDQTVDRNARVGDEPRAVVLMNFSTQDNTLHDAGAMTALSLRGALDCMLNNRCPSGRSGERFGSATASTRSLPSRRKPSTGPSVVNIIGTWPPTSAGTAGALPWKGTCVSCTPADLANSSARMCMGVP